MAFVVSIGVLSGALLLSLLVIFPVQLIIHSLYSNYTYQRWFQESLKHQKKELINTLVSLEKKISSDIQSESNKLANTVKESESNLNKRVEALASQSDQLIKELMSKLQEKLDSEIKENKNEAILQVKELQSILSNQLKESTVQINELILKIEEQLNQKVTASQKQNLSQLKEIDEKLSLEINNLKQQVSVEIKQSKEENISNFNALKEESYLNILNIKDKLLSAYTSSHIETLRRLGFISNTIAAENKSLKSSISHSYDKSQSELSQLIDQNDSSTQQLIKLNTKHLESIQHLGNKNLDKTNEINEKLDLVPEKIYKNITEDIRLHFETIKQLSKDNQQSLNENHSNIVSQLNQFTQMQAEFDKLMSNVKLSLSSQLSSIQEVQEGVKVQTDKISAEQQKFSVAIKEAFAAELLSNLDKQKNELTSLIEQVSEYQNSKFFEIEENQQNVKLSVLKNFKETIQEYHSFITSSFENLQHSLVSKIDEESTQQNKTIASNSKAIQQGVIQEVIANNSKEEINNLINLLKTDLTIFKSNELVDLVEKNSDKLLSELKSSNISDLNTTYDRIDALLSIHSILDLNAPLPIMHEWTVSSDYGLIMITKALGFGKGTFIDIGSGISTILLAYAAKQNGSGKVISFEHSEDYYHKTMELIKFHGLEDYCDLCLCPLIEYDLDGKSWLWYDISKVDLPDDIKLISVDGPPGATQKNARYPAAAILIDSIKEDTLVLLDDGYRDDEKSLAYHWSRNFNLKKQLIKSHKGTFVFKK